MNRTHVALISAFIILVATSFAQPRMEHRGRPPISDDREAMMDKLQLTDEQQIKAGKLRIDFQRQEAEVESKIRIARLDMKELFMAENLDRVSIEKKLKSISDLQYQMKLAHVNHLFAVREILTPEQRKVWKNHFVDSKKHGDRERPRMERRREMMREWDDD